MYVIKELENVNSDRIGYHVKGSLSAAKRVASRRQMFQGTVLLIESETGFPVSVKEGKTWRDYPLDYP